MEAARQSMQYMVLNVKSNQLVMEVTYNSAVQSTLVIIIFDPQRAETAFGQVIGRWSNCSASENMFRGLSTCFETLFVSSTKHRTQHRTQHSNSKPMPLISVCV